MGSEERRRVVQPRFSAPESHPVWKAPGVASAPVFVPPSFEILPPADDNTDRVPEPEAVDLTKIDRPNTVTFTLPKGETVLVEGANGPCMVFSLNRWVDQLVITREITEGISGRGDSDQIRMYHPYTPAELDARRGKYRTRNMPLSRIAAVYVGLDHEIVLGEEGEGQRTFILRSTEQVSIRSLVLEPGVSPRGYLKGANTSRMKG